MYRTVVLIRPDTKYPQLNPLTTQQEQDVGDQCLDISPCYATAQPAQTRTEAAQFILPALSPSWFVCLSHEELTPISDVYKLHWQSQSPKMKRGTVVVSVVLTNSNHQGKEVGFVATVSMGNEIWMTLMSLICVFWLT